MNVGVTEVSIPFPNPDMFVFIGLPDIMTTFSCNDKQQNVCLFEDKSYMLIAVDADVPEEFSELGTAARPMVHMFVHDMRIQAHPDDSATATLTVGLLNYLRIHFGAGVVQKVQMLFS